MKSELGQQIRELRKEKGETLHQVSMGTDIDSPLLSKIERGERMPTLEQLTRLCLYFNVSEPDLKVKYIAEKIIKEYGENETTYEAVQVVCEQLEFATYQKKTDTK